MNRCNSCKVLVYPQHERCPLCDSALGEKGHSNTAYPTPLPGKKKSQVLKILLFLCIAAAVICAFISIFSPYHLWSVIVCAALITLWGVVSSAASKTISPGAKLFNIFIAIIFLLLVIDLCTGFRKWSTTFAIPFMAIGLTAILTILAGRDRKLYLKYRGYLLAMFFVSLCPIIVFLLSLSLYAWTAYVAAIYAILTGVGFWIFADEGFKTEMKKRFHL